MMFLRHFSYTANRHRVSPEFIILRTDGVHCRESAGTEPVALKVVPVTGAARTGHHGPINVRLFFPTPNMEAACTIQKGLEAVYIWIPCRRENTCVDLAMIVMLLFKQKSEHTWTF